ncbi:MAG: hypothetical protein D6765_17125 [Bacteroidetes bacterium]|nr:MAG: hypothetical protein D6765_17125 [Bacteroidota bacterium]
MPAKSILPCAFLFLAFLPLQLAAQQTDAAGFETFEYQEGDTTYVMKKYFLCLLKTGPNREGTEEEVAEIQRQHLAHLETLARAGKICMVGPMGDDGDLRGIVVFNTPTLEDALELAHQDPAVKAGRLSVEIHPWWAAVGSRLF